MDQITKPNSQACSRCFAPLILQSVQTIGPIKVNVYRCEACDKMEAKEQPSDA